jgi:hypothetical protein
MGLVHVPITEAVVPTVAIEVACLTEEAGEDTKLPDHLRKGMRR